MTKREAFEQALAACYEVLVVVAEDPRVDLPAKAWASPMLGAPATAILAYGLDMAKPIPDLETTDDGIRATLSFSCTLCPTFVPWACVLGFRGDGERPKQRAQLRAI
jgi:hypothetical protein